MSSVRKGLIAVGVVVLAGGVSAALYSKSNSQKDKGFKTVPVSRGAVVEKALAVGAIRPKREIAVKSKISGIVKTSFRQVGDVVRAGDPLFEIIPAPTTGTVLELLVNEGDPVVPLTSYQAGTALTNLADMTTLIFKGTVDEIDVGKLREGMAARIKIGALPDAKVDGKVSKIAPKSKTAEGAT